MKVSINNSVTIERRHVFQQLGYSEEEKPHELVASLTDDCIRKSQELESPAYSFAIKRVLSVAENTSIIEDSVVLESRVIARLLEPCEKAAIFVVTVGNSIEKEIRRLAENDMSLEAVVLDAVASLSVEQLASVVGQKIRRLVSPDGFTLSRRFSPGYCDWPLHQQERIFQILGDATAGIILTKNQQMRPEKSISGIIGLSKANIATYNPCRNCQKRDCPGRR